MLSNYNDAWFMNESLAFYMSTNTFRNPIFDTNLEQDHQYDEIENIGQLSSSVAVGRTSTTSHGDARAKQDGRPESGERRSSKSRVANYSFATKQKLNDFRDNLAFSIKGKIFVFELSFKRRLRRLRKFLNKNLPWVLPNKPSSTTRAGNNVGLDYKCVNGGSKLDNFQAPIKHQDVLFWQKVQPDSAKSLGVQQERLLSRLEKAKRDSHKLFNMDQSRFASFFEDGQHETTQRTNSINSFNHNVPANRHQMRLNRPASKGASQARVGDSDGFLTDMVEDLCSPLPSSWSLGSTDRLTPKSHSAPLSWPNDQASDRSLGGTGDGGGLVRAPKTKAGGAQKAAKTSTTTTTTATATATKIISRAGKGKSRWISSGRQIKQAVFSLANSEKLCIVCYNNAPNIVTLPCEHNDICSDCFIEIIYLAVKHGRYPLKCVLCRQKIERIRCSRRLLLKVIERNRTK